MRWLAKSSYYVKSLFSKRRLDAQLTEEIRTHVEMATEANVAKGMAPEDARYAALREFGNVAGIREQTRDEHGWVWLEQFLQDSQHAVRALIHWRGFTCVAVATLALGLGVNAALFSVFNAVVLRPLPLKHAEELVDLVGRNEIGWRISGFSYPEYLDLRAGQRAVPNLAAWLETMVTMDKTEVYALSFVESRFSSGLAHLPLQFVSQNFFDVLGAELAFGRTFRPEENLTPGANPVIVLQHQFWAQQFHSDSEVLGKTIKLRDTVFTVIGVAASEFVGKTPAPPIGWVPAMMCDALAGKGSHMLAQRHNTRFELVARVPAGLVREQARAELEVLSRQLAEKYPDDHPKTRIEFKNSGTFMSVPLNRRMLVASSLVWLSFAMVLLIACANVANLLLARASTRQQEIGVRLALGASRGRIIRHLLMESMLLALVGGLAGLLIATWTLQAVRPAIIAMVPPSGSLGLREWLFVNLTPDYRVFGFTLILAFMAALAAGLSPALQAARVDVNAALKIGGSLLSPQSRLRHSLVVIQVATCFTLLTASGFLVQLVLSNATMETGLHTDNIYAANLSLLPAEMSTRSDSARRQAAEALQLPAARREALALARTLPGIKAVAQMYRVPFSGRMRHTPVALDDREAAGTPLFAKFNLVSTDYFAVLGIAMAKGRTFTASEVERQVPVVVISEATARRYWPGEDPLGKRLKISSVASEGGWVTPRQARQEAIGTFSSYEVIGVAPDTRSGWVWESDETMLYLPLPDDSPLAKTLLQFTGPRATALPLALGAASAQGVSLSLNVIVALEEAKDLQLLPYKGVAAVGAGLGALALLMALVGLYGMMAFVVSQRVREIGIRTALGATAENIVGLFVRQGMHLVAIGLALGSIGGVVVAIVLSKIVVGAQSFDPLVCGAVALLLAIATLFACWLPARRAAKVDPMLAVRAE